MPIYTWEPGVGTRYEVSISPFTGTMFGCTDGWLIVGPYTATLKAMVIPKNQPLHWTYITAKMDLGRMDASIVTYMIGEVTGNLTYPDVDCMERVTVPFIPSRPQESVAQD